jgi:hypothetical protein
MRMPKLIGLILATLTVLLAVPAAAQLNQVGRWQSGDITLDLQQDGTFTLENAPGGEGHDVLTGRYIVPASNTLMVMRVSEFNRGERLTLHAMGDDELDIESPLLGGRVVFTRAFEWAHVLGSKPGVFIGLTVVVMGFAAFMTGQALGRGWKPAWMVLPYAIGMAFADRFLQFALYHENLQSLNGLVFSALVLSIIGFASHRRARVACLAAQYPWLIERTGPFSWRDKSPAP